MKKIKNILCVLLCLTVALFAFACGNSTPSGNGGNTETPGGNTETPGGNTETPGGNTETPGGGNEQGGEKPTPVVRADRDGKFLIGTWRTLYSENTESYDSQLKRLHDAGLNFSTFPYEYEQNVTEYEEWARIDGLCEKYEMFYNISSYKYNPEAMMTQHSINKMELDIEIGEKMVADGKGKYWMGYHLWDEPFYSVLPTTAQWFKDYYAQDPEHPPFVNLNGSAGDSGKSFYQYLQQWATLAGDGLEWLSYDLYPFGLGITHDAVKFSNMEDLRKVANEHGLKGHAFVQTSPVEINFRQPNLSEITWDVWGLVTYGFKAFTYFNYVCNELIPGDGSVNNQELFDGLTVLNHKVRAVGDILVKYDCEHAYHHAGSSYTNVEKLPSDYFITPTDTSTVISQFKPKKDEQDKLYMLFNNSWTSGKTSTYYIDTTDIKRLERFNPTTGKYENVSISGGQFTQTFEAGEGILFRVR